MTNLFAGRARVILHPGDWRRATGAWIGRQGTGTWTWTWTWTWTNGKAAKGSLPMGSPVVAVRQSVSRFLIPVTRIPHPGICIASWILHPATGWKGGTSIQDRVVPFR